VHGQIRRYNLDGSGMEIMARGVRNSVGFDFHPRTGELWFTDNGRDWAGEDVFEDELNRVPANMIGARFGFPYCHANGQPDPDIKVPNPCDGVILPVVTLGAHVAALGMRFYTGKMFPQEYAEAILVARHGSWNKTERNGYDVVMVKATPDGKDAKITPFMTGFLDKAKNSFSGRPTDVMLMPDGSLLVSDEQNGAIYRVTYKK
jgi:glucose/arabinose dehydrogenase